jgi:hypothetical protein
MLQQDDLAMLSPEAQQIYMAQTQIFESDAWKALVEWAQEEHTKSVSRELVASKWDDVVIARGERRAYNRIATLETATENEYQNLVDRAKEMKLMEDETEHE